MPEDKSERSDEIDKSNSQKFKAIKKTQARFPMVFTIQ